jgi:hypothetical protein
MRRYVAAGPALALIPLLALIAGCQDTTSGPSNGESYELQPGQNAVADPGSGLILQVDGDAFEPGAPVSIALINNSDSQIGYNLCLHDLERNVGGEWEPLHIERICTLELRLLAPSDSAAGPAELPEDLEPGEYRFRVAVDLMDDRGIRDLVSDPFQVEG